MNSKVVMAVLCVSAMLAVACGGDGGGAAQDTATDGAATGGAATEGAATEGAADATGTEGDAEGDAAAGGEAWDLAFVQGVRGDEFYISMECGIREAAEEMGANVTVQGPEQFDATLQTPIINAVIADQPDAMLVAPNDVQAMIPPLQEAVDAGITLVTVDTTIDADFMVSEVASDNIEGGREAARALAERLGDTEGSVMVINVNPGISTTDARQQGFEEEIANYDNLEYIGTEFSNNEPAEAASIVNATLAAVPDLVGIFATNLFSAEGAATGLRNAGADVAERVRIVGFDAGPAQIQQLEEGLVQALVAQRPAEIGRHGVEQAINALEGEEVEAEIETGFVIITPDNMDDPEVQEAFYQSEC